MKTVTTKKLTPRKKKRQALDLLVQKERLNLSLTGASPVDWARLDAMSVGGGRPLGIELEEGDRLTYPAPVSEEVHGLLGVYKGLAEIHKVSRCRRGMGAIAGYCVEQVVGDGWDINDPSAISSWLEESPLGMMSPEKNLSDSGFNVRLPLEYRNFIKTVSLQLNAFDTWVLSAIVLSVLRPNLELQGVA